jgi:4'-phosphopantetheinyl transferase
MMASARGGCKIAGMIPEPLDPDTVRVRWLPVESNAGHLRRWRGMLNAEELARADRYAFASDRDTYTAAHALVRTMLSRATGLPTAEWRYTRRPFGKPELAASCAGSGLQFNLSHTRGLVACAVAYAEIGLDVEASDHGTDFAIADQFFAPEEARLVNTAPPEQKPFLFFRFWTLKEAFIKATGEGLHRRLDSFSFSFDLLRIAFHPEREETPHHDEPAAWQFFAHHATENHPLALAVQRPRQRPVRLDMQAAQADDLTMVKADLTG